MSNAHGGLRSVSAPGDDDLGADILHVDMDAFFASVEQLDFPELRNRPVIIGALVERSVVSSASYEARRFGVRSAMPVAQAKRLCPNAVFVPGRMARYREVSNSVMEVFRSFTPKVEALSIDEAFLDVSGARRLFGSPGQVAFAVREQISAELGLPCSVGAGAVKHVAKIASTLAKPGGVLLVPEAETVDFLAPLPVRMLWGIGSTAGQRLAAYGINTVEELRVTDLPVLERILGVTLAARVSELAAGRAVAGGEVAAQRSVEKSVSHEVTFSSDVSEARVIDREFRALADRVAHRLRRAGLYAGGVAIKVRTGSFETVSRSMTLDSATQTGQRLALSAQELFKRANVSQPLRLIGLRAEKLVSEPLVLPLWDEDERWVALDSLRDKLRDSFGVDAVQRAESLNVEGVPQHHVPRNLEDFS